MYWMASLFIALALPALADWTKTDTQVRSGNILKVVCQGSAPIGAVDIARSEALQVCRNTAISHLQTNLTQKSLIVETETSVGLHSETVQNASYVGLDCKSEKEKIEENQDKGAVTVFIKCSFDLSKAKVKEIEDHADLPDKTNSGLIVNKDKATELPTVKVERLRKFDGSLNRTLILSTVPKCDSIVVRGRPRKLNCEANPMTILIYPDDTEIILRKSGFKPKHIKLNIEHQSGEPETLEVFFGKS